MTFAFAGGMQAGVALLTGVIVAFVVARLAVRQIGADVDDDAQAAKRADLEARLASLVGVLRDIEAQRERLDHADYMAQKTDLELRAASLLRTLTSPQKTSVRPDKGQLKTPRGVVMGFFHDRPQLRGALWGGGVVGVAFFLMQLVQQEGVPQARSAPSAQDAGQGEIAALTEQLRKHPDDVPALLRLAHVLLRATLLDEAKAVNDKALQLEPANVEAQVHAAVLQAGDGHADRAINQLSDILKTHDDFAEGWFFRGMLAMQAGNTPLMQESFRRFVAHAPPGAQRDRIAQMLQN